jgi:hypothetical protein
MKRITKKWLLKIGVGPGCPDFQTFNRLWPDGADVTLDNALHAVANGIALSIFASLHLSKARQRRFWRAAKAAHEEFCHRRGRSQTERGQSRVCRRYERAVAPVLVAVLLNKKPPEAVY